MLPSNILEIALEAATKAEKFILDYYQGKIEFETKDDLSPVTIADKKAEEIIRDHISQQFPSHGFLGEEFGESEPENEFVWIIDPIDGTKNFIKGIPTFGTQLALRQGEEIVLGISNLMGMKEMYYAQKGNGSYKNNQKISVSQTQNLKDAYFANGNLEYFIKTGTLNNFAELVKNTYYSRGYGDVWGHSLVADGRIDFMIEASISIWDVAASIILIEEAGGKVTDWNGNPIHTKSKRIISSNGNFHSEIIEIMNDK